MVIDVKEEILLPEIPLLNRIPLLLLEFHYIALLAEICYIVLHDITRISFCYQNSYAVLEFYYIILTEFCYLSEISLSCITKIPELHYITWREFHDIRGITLCCINRITNKCSIWFLKSKKLLTWRQAFAFCTRRLHHVCGKLFSAILTVIDGTGMVFVLHILDVLACSWLWALGVE